MTGGKGENDAAGEAGGDCAAGEAGGDCATGLRAETMRPARVRGSDSEFAEVYKIERVNRVI